MSSAYRQGQVTTQYSVHQSVKSEIGRIMVQQESLFKHQVRELHTLYNKQLELVNEYKATEIGRTQDQFESSGKLVNNPNCYLEGTINTCEIAKVRVMVGMEQNVAVPPELMNPSLARGKQVDQERSIIAKNLDVMSSSPDRGASRSLLWFANVVTSVNNMEIGQSSVQ